MKNTNYLLLVLASLALSVSLGDSTLVIITTNFNNVLMSCKEGVLPARCSENINCATCVTNSSCTWCTTSRNCLENANAYQCSCQSCKTCLRHGSSAICPANFGACSAHSSCATCTQDPACGWSSYTASCMEGDATGSCSGPTQCAGPANSSWHFGPKAVCPASLSGCGQHSNCMACTQDPACGWNVYQGICIPGDQQGSCEAATRCSGSASRNLYWQFGEKALCARNYGTCKQYTNCMSCTTDPACGWNVYLQSCMEGDKYGSCSAPSSCTGAADRGLYWQYGANAACPKYHDKCLQYSNCMACTQDPACGWNINMKQCQEGDQYGPCQDSALCSGAASKGLYWQYGSASLCPKNFDDCGQYTNCMSCTTDPACGWNVYLQTCVSGDKYGACSSDSHCSGGADTNYYWQYGTNAICPARYQTCTQYTTCNSCTADSACGWDTNYQQCYPGDENGACSGGSGISSAWKFGHC